MLEILHKHKPFEWIRDLDNCDVRVYFLWRFFTWPRNYYNDNNSRTLCCAFYHLQVAKEEVFPVPTATEPIPMLWPSIGPEVLTKCTKFVSVIIFRLWEREFFLWQRQQHSLRLHWSSTGLRQTVWLQWNLCWWKRLFLQQTNNDHFNNNGNNHSSYKTFKKEYGWVCALKMFVYALSSFPQRNALSRAHC